MGKGTIAVLVGVLMAGGAAFADPYQMPMGTAVVDGDLSEWTGAEWIDMDQIYHGDPADLSGAKWAARWAPDVIYLAVTGVDSDLALNASHQGWDQQDAVEVYVDAANKNNNAYNGSFADAQQFVGAPDGTPGGEWLTLAGQALPAGAVSAFEATVVGDVISYEMALTPYDTFDMGDPASSTVLTLAAGMTVGLDVAMNTKHAGGFGMLCENTNGGKYADAAQFLDHVLVPEPTTIAMLLASGICLVACMWRRRRRP